MLLLTLALLLATPLLANAEGKTVKPRPKEPATCANCAGAECVELRCLESGKDLTYSPCNRFDPACDGGGDHLPDGAGWGNPGGFAPPDRPAPPPGLPPKPGEVGEFPGLSYEDLIATCDPFGGGEAPRRVGAQRVICVSNGVRWECTAQKFKGTMRYDCVGEKEANGSAPSARRPGILSDERRERVFKPASEPKASRGEYRDGVKPRRNGVMKPGRAMPRANLPTPSATNPPEWPTVD